MGDETILTSSGEGEHFVLTSRLRWVTRLVKLLPFYHPSETTTQVLQQMWKGNKGTQRWEDVPTETELI
jgi:hypothetical protein